ncbi:MAG: hypothetical protein DMG12_24400 [Acidobacteria bacterium]|nr:MAG: hypothetical protein DMG12_24400 [Acidobacteriota bacterium]
MRDCGGGSRRSTGDIQDHQARLGEPAGQGVVEGNELPYRPEALAKKRQNFENRSTADPDSKGYLPGVPRIMYMPFPFQILQTRDHVAIAFEYDRGIRTIYTNGTEHPKGAINWWMGDSRGRWDGNTLVIDVTNLNGIRGLTTPGTSILTPRIWSNA